MKLNLDLSIFKLFAFLIIFATASSANECLQSYTLSASSTKILNAQMLSKYPNLKFVIENPDIFIETINNRFELQKKIDPMNPYNFDYSEVGIPLIRDIVKDLEQWSKVLDAEIKNLQKQIFIFKSNKSNLILLHEFSQKLLIEAKSYNNANSISYKDLIEFSYFYARMRGLLDSKDYSPLTKLYLFIDRKINGNRQLSIKKELEQYKNRKFSIFQSFSFSSGFRKASVSFENLFADKKNLPSIWIPTNAPLNRDIFMRLMNKNINIIGVTTEPILADGILRPSGDFWNHDVRHESGKIYETNNYIKSQNLTEAEYKKMGQLIDKWLLELNSEINNVADKDLREALELQTFNFHHDRGFPLIPSIYLNFKNDTVSLWLYFFQKSSGEGVSFSNPVENFRKADIWLKQFWNRRLQEELTFIENLAKSPQFTDTH